MDSGRSEQELPSVTPMGAPLMTITDESRFHLHQRLAEVLGQEEASTLMEHLPPVGWADVATRRDLDHAFAHLEATFDRQFALQRAEFIDRFGQIDGRLGRLEGRIDALDIRIDRLEQRIDGLERRIDGLDVRIDRLERRIDGLDAKIDSRFNEADAKIDSRLNEADSRLDSRFNEFEAKLDAKLDARLAGVQADLSRQMLATTLAGNSVLVALVFGITRLLG